MRSKSLIFFILFYSSISYAQYNSGGTQFYIGPRVSLNAAKYTPGKNIPNVPEAYERSLGYGAGFMYKFRVTDFISLHGEMSFVRKTRSVVDSTLVTEFQNFHLDAPILFELNFQAKNEKIGEFEYFFNAGPQISYWLGGKGNTQVINNPEDISTSYDISFSNSSQQPFNGEDLNRLQYGFIFGAGLTLPSVGDNFFVIEARYYFCQTYLGDKYTGSIGDFSYQDDMRGNYQIFSLAFSYTFGLNFMPSTEKKSGMKVKTVVK